MGRVFESPVRKKPVLAAHKRRAMIAEMLREHNARMDAQREQEARRFDHPGSLIGAFAGQRVSPETVQQFSASGSLISAMLR